MENKFCFLKGIVECDSGRIQDCNNKRTTSCPLGNKKPAAKQGFCYLKGMVGCSAGRVQDCNIKRVEVCPKD